MISYGCLGFNGTFLLGVGSTPLEAYFVTRRARGAQRAGEGVEERRRGKGRGEES